MEMGGRELEIVEKAAPEKSRSLEPEIALPPTPPPILVWAERAARQRQNERGD